MGRSLKDLTNIKKDFFFVFLCFGTCSIGVLRKNYFVIESLFSPPRFARMFSETFEISACGWAFVERTFEIEYHYIMAII